MVEPERDYCYRVTALAGRRTGSVAEGCVSTPALASMTCTDDPKNNRSLVEEILRSSEPFWVEWREAVGLTDADPLRLAIVDDDATCNSLWSEASRSDAEPYELIAFFRLGNRYIVTNNVNTDRSFGPTGGGLSITTVLDDKMQVILHAAH